MPVPRKNSPANPLQWINVDKPKEKQKAEVQKLVRCHVMRGHKREQRQKLTEAYQKARRSSDEDWSESGGQSVSSQVAGTRTKDASSHSSQAVLWKGRDHPLLNLSPGGDWMSNSMLSHFASVLAPALLPLDHGRGDNPLNLFALRAMQEPALLNAILLKVSTHHDSLRGLLAPSFETMRLQCETIRLVQSQLTTGDPNLPDSTIAAVAVMALNEHISGNYVAMVMHMDALEKMVKLRGGLRALGMDGILHMLISWQDMLTSTVLLTRPRFAKTTCNVVLLGLGTLVGHAIFKGEKDEDDDDDHAHSIVCDHLLTIFQNIRVLSVVLESFDGGKAASANEMMSFSKLRSAIEYELVSLPTDINSCSTDPETAILCRLCRVATHIYINHILRNFGPAFATMRFLKKHLMQEYDSLSEDEMTLDNLASWRSIFWALAIGSLLAQDREEKIWFVGKIMYAKAMLGIFDGDIDVEATLRQYPWTKGISIHLANLLADFGDEST
ncbi:hypothetical protein MMC25_007684 [Agyrium rufum]|nr:hypothetical protein [Agyrium rufum]